MLPAHIQMRELHLKADVPKGRLLGRSRVPGVGSQEPAPGSAWLPALRCQTRTCAWPREADKWPGLNDQRRSKRGRIAFSQRRGSGREVWRLEKRKAPLLLRL